MLHNNSWKRGRGAMDEKINKVWWSKEKHRQIVVCRALCWAGANDEVESVWRRLLGGSPVECLYWWRGRKCVIDRSSSRDFGFFGIFMKRISPIKNSWNWAAIIFRWEIWNLSRTRWIWSLNFFSFRLSITGFILVYWDIFLFFFYEIQFEFLS